MVPRGIMGKVTGIVSKAFLPYLSDRFPSTGIITNDPSPIIYINRYLLTQLLYIPTFLPSGFWSYHYESVKTA